METSIEIKGATRWVAPVALGGTGVLPEPGPIIVARLAPLSRLGLAGVQRRNEHAGGAAGGVIIGGQAGGAVAVDGDIGGRAGGAEREITDSIIIGDIADDAARPGQADAEIGIIAGHTVADGAGIDGDAIVIVRGGAIFRQVVFASQVETVPTIIKP